MQLTEGDRFPELSLSLVGDGTIGFEDIATGWVVLLFYRGHW